MRSHPQIYVERVPSQKLVEMICLCTSSRTSGSASGAKSKVHHKAGVHARVCGGVMACQGEGGTLAEPLENK